MHFIISKVHAWSRWLNAFLQCYILPRGLRTYYMSLCVLGSVVGIVTGYRLDGPGIESRWGRDFPHLSRPALGPTQPHVQWVLGLYQVKRAAGA